MTAHDLALAHEPERDEPDDAPTCFGRVAAELRARAPREGDRDLLLRELEAADAALLDADATALAMAQRATIAESKVAYLESMLAMARAELRGGP